jgi:hypothetical protein
MENPVCACLLADKSPVYIPARCAVGAFTNLPFALQPVGIVVKLGLASKPLLFEQMVDTARSRRFSSASVVGSRFVWLTAVSCTSR